MGIALLVVEHGPLLDRFLGNGQVDANHTSRGGPWVAGLAEGHGRGGFHRQLQGIEQAAGIAAGHIHQMGRRLGADLDAPPAVAPLRISQGPLQQGLEMGWLQRFHAE